MGKEELYFILSASCKIVKGLYRSIIIDYLRRNVYYISNEYFDLIDVMDRKLILEMEKKMEDEESLSNYHEFLDFLLKNEIGIIVNDPNLFPKISTHPEQEPRDIKNAIIEIDEANYDEILFKKICFELKDLKCIDLQLRLYSSTSIEFLSKLITIIYDNEFRYLEILCKYDDIESKDFVDFVSKNRILSNMYIYDAPFTEKIEVNVGLSNSTQLLMGQLYFLKEKFDPVHSCGIINIQTLDFSHIHNFNRLKEQNGCLYKKVAVDREGNIKNCPSFNFNYGNIRINNIKEIIKKSDFRKYWHLNKDLIDTCKDCEYRYNCTDCRVYVNKEKGFYGKPSKCNYELTNGLWK